MATVRDEDLNDTIWQELQCYECNRTCLRGEIFSCSGGHLVCYSCAEDLERCPTCTVPGNPLIRCIALEKIRDKLKVSCKNAPHGCTALVNIADMNEHLEYCNKQLLDDCMICYSPTTEESDPACARESERQDLVDHVTSRHEGKHGEESVQIDVSIDEKPQQWIVRLVSAFEENFWVFCLYKPTPDESLSLWSCLNVRDGGEEEKNPRFQCKFTYFSAEDSVRKDITVPIWSKTTYLRNCHTLQKEQLDDSISDGKFSLTIQILKK